MIKFFSKLISVLIKYSNMFFENILIAITLNKSSIKGSLSFFVFLYFCVYSSIMIRLDFYYNWLQFIPFELFFI
jgi:hypothetical protein